MKGERHKMQMRKEWLKENKVPIYFEEQRRGIAVLDNWSKVNDKF